MLIDAHCHLNLLGDPKLEGGGIEEIWEQAKEAGITGCLIPSVVRKDWDEVIELVRRHQEFYGAIAVHPGEINDPPVTLEELVEYGRKPEVAGIGEAGLDFDSESSEEEKRRQLTLFELHIEAALRINKPLIVHARNAWPLLLDVLHRFPVDRIGGMVHCFTGDYEAAKAILDLGWYLSFSGIVTFKRSDNLRGVLRKLPVDRILLETDAPYLAPEPVRGRPNRPEFLRYTAALVADLLGKEVEELGEITGGNFMSLVRR